MSEPCGPVARFLSENAEAFFFHTEQPTGTDGAARILAQKYESEVGGKPGIDVVAHKLREVLEGCDEVHDNVLRAWVAYYTPPKKRKKLLRIMGSCIVYPMYPEVQVCDSSINISPITRKSDRINVWDAITELFVARPQCSQDFGIRCVETIIFKIKDGDIGTEFEDVRMYVNYDIFGMLGHQSVEMCNFGFKVFPHQRYVVRGGCEWKNPEKYKSVFSFKELELMARASVNEDMFVGWGSEEEQGKGNVAFQKRTPTGRFSYQKLLQQHMDENAMRAKWDASNAIGKHSFKPRNTAFLDTDFFKDKQTFCETAFGLSDDKLLSTLANSVIVAEDNSLQRSARLESRQKVSIRVQDEYGRKRYKVIEHASIRVPLSSNNLHVMLSYEMAKPLENAKGVRSHMGVEIFNAKLGVRPVRVGFVLHKCSWSYYRSTDFVTFLIPNCECTLDYRLLDCWNRAVESDISGKESHVVETMLFPWGSEAIEINTNVPGYASANVTEEAPALGVKELSRADSSQRLEEQKHSSELRELASKARRQWLDDAVVRLDSQVLKKNMSAVNVIVHEVSNRRSAESPKVSYREKEREKPAKGKRAMPKYLGGLWESIQYAIRRILQFIFLPFIKLVRWLEGLANRRLKQREKERAEAERLAAERAESKKKGGFFSWVKKRFSRGDHGEDPAANKSSADKNEASDLAQEDSAKDRKDPSAEEKDNPEAKTYSKKFWFKLGKGKNKGKKATSGKDASQQDEDKVLPNTVVLKAVEREEEPLRPPPGYGDDDSNNRKKQEQEAGHLRSNEVPIAASDRQKGTDARVADVKPADFWGQGGDQVTTALRDVTTEAQQSVQQEK
ncbi:MAG: hypothetical protein ACTJLK_03365 [Anaplasma sp.]